MNPKNMPSDDELIASIKAAGHDPWAEMSRADAQRLLGRNADVSALPSLIRLDVQRAYHASLRPAVDRADLERKIRSRGFDPHEQLDHVAAAGLIGCRASEVAGMLASGELQSLSRIDCALAELPSNRGVSRMGSCIGLGV